MATPVVTYSFTNGSTSDATQVNTNFTDVINAFTNGSADLAIGTLTVAGAVTFNGNVTLGNASADDITFTGAVESHIPFGTNATYDIGAATLAPRSLYLGNGTKSTRIIAGTVGTSWTFTLPNDVSATGQGLIFNSSGTAEFRYEDKFTASKTTAYTATGDETIIPCAPAASFTVTLPAASTMTGKSLTIIKTDSDISKTVTIDGNASETINGALTYILYTQYESVTIKCDGSNWFIEQHYAQTPWVSAGVITIGATTTPPTKATTRQNDQLWWRRQGDSAQIRVEYSATSAAGSAAGSGDYLFGLPTGITIDTTKIAVSTVVGTPYDTFSSLGIANYSTGSLLTAGGIYAYSTSYVRFFTMSATQTGVIGSAYGPLTTANLGISAIFTIPVTGWQP